MDSNRPSAGKWVSRRALAQQAQSRECMNTTAINCNTSTNSRPPQPRSATVNRNGSDNDHYHRHGYVHDNRSGSGLYYSRNTNNHNGGSSVMKAVNANHHSRYYNSKSSDGSDLSPPPPRSAQLANGTAAGRPHSSYIPSPRHASQFGIEPHNISNSRWAPPPAAPMSSNGPSMLGIYEQPLASNPPSFVQALQGKPALPSFTNGNSSGHCGFSTSAPDAMPPPPQYVAMPSNKSPAPQYRQSPLLTLTPTPAPVPASVTARSPSDAPASLVAAMDLSTMLHHMALRGSESHPSPPSGSSAALEEAAQQIGLMLPVLDDDDEDVRSAKPHSSVAMASLLDSWNNGGISTTAADFAITFDAATTAGSTDPSRQMNLNKAFSTAPVVPPVNPISASLFSQLTGESPEATEGTTGFTGFSALHCDLNPPVPAQPKSTDLRDLFSELTQPGGNDLETVGDVPGSVSWPTLPPLENSNASFGQEGPSGKVASSAWKQLCVQIAAPADFAAPRVDINSTPLIPGSTSSLLTDASTPLCAKRDSSQPHTPAAIRQQRPSLDPPTVTRLSLACIFRETPQSQRRREKALETSQRPDTLTQSHHWPPRTDAEVERMLKQRSALKLLRHLTIISYSRQHVKGVQELFETWARNGIPAPDMGFGAYYYYVKEKSEKLLCMKHNGRGATPGHGYGKCDFESRRPNSTCRYEHVCLFCRSKEHGWFEEGKCDGYQQLLNEAEVLGITDESIEVLLNAMEKTSAWTH